MFEFQLDQKKCRSSCWIATAPMEFLILLDGVESFVSSDELSREDYLNLLILNSLSENKICKDSECSDIYDLREIKFEKLSVFELVTFYRRLFGRDSKKISSLKSQIRAALVERIRNCEENGADCGIYKFKDFVKEAMSLNITDEDDGIENLIEEFSLFLKIKAYQYMNLYELIIEKDRFSEVIRGEKEIDTLGFPMVDLNTLKTRLLPALKVLIAMKEDIYLLELLNFKREYLKLNPFIVTDLELSRIYRTPFKYKSSSVLEYDYKFFENLGINTMFSNYEFGSLSKWQFDYICEYIYGICASEINRMAYTQAFSEKLANVKKIFGRYDFVNYFLNYIYNVIKI